ncbi:MAG: PIN domain-containing protein [Dehalococcoidia bacterium]|nr:PIN domain-containing protein [Dehalococcoidia bacterium]
MGILIDTSVLIGLERRGASLDVLNEIGDELAISAVSLSELLFGLHRARTIEQRQQRQEFIDTALEVLPLLPVDRVVAEVHARIWSDLTAAGQLIGTHDFFIAATAIAYDYALLTHNAREFARIPAFRSANPAGNPLYCAACPTSTSSPSPAKPTPPTSPSATSASRRTAPPSSATAARPTATTPTASASSALITRPSSMPSWAGSMWSTPAIRTAATISTR